MSDGMILRTGVHAPLEDAANEILRVSMAGITRHSDKSDILTPWKEHARRSREIYVASGTPDPALRKGTFGRAANLTHLHLNSIDGMVSPRTSRASSTNPWDHE